MDSFKPLYVAVRAVIILKQTLIMDIEMKNQFIKSAVTEVNGSEDKASIRKRFAAIGLVLTVLVVSIQIFEAVLYAIVDRKAPELWEKPWMSWIIVAAGFYLTAFPIYCFLMRKIPDAPKGEPKLMKAGDLISLFFIGMASLYIFNFVSLLINTGISSIKGSGVINPLTNAVNSSNVLYTFLFAGIIAPVIEEIIFRGILLDKVRGYGDKKAVWFTAIVFGLFHLNTSQLLYSIALGIIFAYVVLKTNRIIYSVILHVAINLMGSVAAPVLAGAGYYSALGTMIIAMIVIGSILFIIKSRRPAGNETVQPVSREPGNPVIYGNPGMILYIGLCTVLIIVMTVF